MTDTPHSLDCIYQASLDHVSIVGEFMYFFVSHNSALKLELTLNKCWLELSIVTRDIFVISDLTTMAAGIDLK